MSTSSGDSHDLESPGMNDHFKATVILLVKGSPVFLNRVDDTAKRSG